MARTTKAERKRRREAALAKISDGHGFADTVAFVMQEWGKLADLDLHPHRLRHSHATHAVRRGVDVFTLQSTLGHSSAATTGHYVAANPEDSSSLRLG